MDRNPAVEPVVWTQTLVALRKESVDRNAYVVAKQHYYQGSLSARRAWIEIIFARYLPFYE